MDLENLKVIFRIPFLLSSLLEELLPSYSLDRMAVFELSSVEMIVLEIVYLLYMVVCHLIAD